MYSTSGPNTLSGKKKTRFRFQVELFGKLSFRTIAQRRAPISSCQHKFTSDNLAQLEVA